MPFNLWSRGLRGTLAVLAAILLLPLAAPAAQAQDAYRYWSYYWGQDGAWTYAQTGPADRVVSDGDVEGWRFLVSADAEPSDQPREAPDFTAICDDKPAAVGEVRVGVVIDYGTDQIAPAGSTIPIDADVEAACVVVPEGTNAEQVLTAATEVRSEGGAVCAINGYPASGCFELVSASEVSAAEDAPAAALWLGAGALAGLAAVIALMLARKRNKPTA